MRRIAMSKRERGFIRFFNAGLVVEANERNGNEPYPVQGFKSIFTG